AGAVVVEVEDGVEERVRQARVVGLLVGVGDVDVAFEQAGGEVLGDVGAAAHPEGRVVRFAPDVRLALHVRGVAGLGPGTDLQVGVGEHRVGRDQVLAEVLVLVVAPDHHGVRVEVVDRGPYLLEALDQGLPVLGRAGRAAVVAPLAAGGLGPAGRVLGLGGDAGVGHGAP